jgi:hypothetical protein
MVEWEWQVKPKCWQLKMSHCHSARHRPQPNPVLRGDRPQPQHCLNGENTAGIETTNKIRINWQISLTQLILQLKTDLRACFGLLQKQLPAQLNCTQQCIANKEGILTWRRSTTTQWKHNKAHSSENVYLRTDMFRLTGIPQQHNRGFISGFISVARPTVLLYTWFLQHH